MPLDSLARIIDHVRTLALGVRKPGFNLTNGVNSLSDLGQVTFPLLGYKDSTVYQALTTSKAGLQTHHWLYTPRSFHWPSIFPN